MKNLKVPEWWDSIRAILALILSISYCIGILCLKIPKADLDGLQQLSTMAVVFYFVLKKRNGEEVNGSDNGSDGDPKDNIVKNDKPI